MSTASHLIAFFDLRVPAWLALWAITAMAIAQHFWITRRLDGHARSIGHMDDWAETVENRLEEYDRKLALIRQDDISTDVALAAASPEPDPGSSRNHFAANVRAIISQLSRRPSRRAA